MPDGMPSRESNHLSVIAKYTPPVGTRLCADCRTKTEVVDLIPFYDEKGTVHRLLCLVCHGKATLQRKREQLQTQAQSAFTKLVSNVTRRSNTANVCDFADGLIKRFGGLEAAVAWAHEQMVKATELRPGSKTALDAVTILSKLIDASSARAPKLMPVAGMNDEELARVVSAYLITHEAGDASAGAA